MTIKQQGGIFGRNPTFNDLDVEGSANLGSNVDINGGSVDGITLGADGQILTDGFLDLYNNGIANTLRISSEGNNPSETNAIEFYRGASTDRVVSKIALNRITDVDTGELRFYLNDTAGTLHQNMTIDDTGNVSLDRGNLVIGTSGKGIDFSATAGTGTSELFDDYEEGTWTPVLSDATSGGNTATLGSSSAHYVKVGSVVHLFMEILNINNTGMTGTNGIVIQGLPYTSSSSVTSSGTVVLDRVAISDFEYVVAQITANTDYIRLVGMVSGAAESSLLVNDFNNTSSDIQHLQISYRV